LGAQLPHANVQYQSKAVQAGIFSSRGEHGMRFAAQLGKVGIICSLALAFTSVADPIPGEPLPQPLAAPGSWWNADVSSAPIDWASADFISFLGRYGTLALHPNLGGLWWEDPGRCFGYPYIAVDDWQPKVTVAFDVPALSDGVGVPFYPIPDEAIWNNLWVEGGQPGHVDARGDDRHILIFDRTNNWLYELYNVWFNLSTWQWHAYAGGFWDMSQAERPPQFRGFADESGLEILPGLLRYEEVYGPDEIQHAIRVALPTADGHVYPATVGFEFTPGSLPLGARLRLRADKDISGYRSDIQKIFRAMKRYGMLATTKSGPGTNYLFVQGTFDPRWENGIINPAFHSLNASDFEVVQRGWRP
jgi:hypothetical protein